MKGIKGWQYQMEGPSKPKGNYPGYICAVCGHKENLVPGGSPKTCGILKTARNEGYGRVTVLFLTLKNVSIAEHDESETGS